MRKTLAFLIPALFSLVACQKPSDDAPWCATGMHETAEPSVFPYEAALTIDIDYSPGKVYYHKDHILVIESKTLKTYSAQNGKELWQWEADEKCPDYPQTLSFYGSDSNKVLLQGYDGLYALELKTGTVLWSNLTGPNQRIAGSAVIGNSTYRLSNVYDRGYLLESTALGSEDWDTIFNRSSAADSNLRSDEIRFYRSPQGDPMAILIQNDFNAQLSTLENTIFKIDLNSGSEEVLSTSNEGLRAVDVIENNFVYKQGKKVFAYDLQSEIQTEIGSQLIGKDGSDLYFLQGENQVQVFDLSSGTEKLTLDFNYALRSYGYRPNENMAAFYDGAMYAVTPETDLAYKDKDGVSDIWGAEESSSEAFGFRRAGMEFLTPVNEEDATFIAVRFNKLYLLRF